MKVKIKNAKVKTASQNSKVLTFRPWVFLFTFSFLVFTLYGCEAFARKFTRKSKKDKVEVMVLAPEEWKGPNMTKEELYRQYFVYWKSWHDELINSFLTNTSQKKKLDCAQQSKKNLVNMRFLLNESKQKQMDVYLKKLDEIKDGVKSDVYGSSNNYFRLASEKLKYNIEQNFSYNHVKNDIPL